MRQLSLVLVVTCLFATASHAGEPLKVGMFDIDASPPVGSPMAYDPTREVTLPLSCRGIVLVGKDRPIVLCAVDWIGIGNDGHRVFREELAEAAGTTSGRVAVHVLHQHDAPWCDFSAVDLAEQQGIHRVLFDSPFARDVIRRAATAVRQAVADAKPATYVGLGEGIVEQVASNRRILGPDGKVQSVRYTATKDAAIRAAPEGVVDRKLKSISFWNDRERMVTLTYYATHPQSYYRTGKANPDFPGMARNQRQQATGVPHIHFNGAGGNIGAGKYNDGAAENRPVLAERVARGMASAWDNERKLPISVDEAGWKSIAVALPVSPHLNEAKLVAGLKDEQLPPRGRLDMAVKLAWVKRCLAGSTIDVGCLTLGSARVLHMPGELFVEYQLAAQEMRPDLFVAMAAYGDYGPCYIGTEIAYEQGGYEPGPNASLVAPSVERVLVDVLQKLLDAPKRPAGGLGVEAAAREPEYARKLEAGK